MKTNAASTADIIRRIHARNPVADPPCSGRVPAPNFFGQGEGLLVKIAIRTAVPCGRPVGHKGKHAWGGCGCPDWDFDQQRCYCYELRHPDCNRCG